MSQLQRTLRYLTNKTLGWCLATVVAFALTPAQGAPCKLLLEQDNEQPESATGSTEELAEEYLDHVKPVLRERCFACHGALKQEAGLRLDTAAAMLEAGVVEPGDVEASYLWERVIAEDELYRMPPEGQPLSAEELELLGRWIQRGATGPADEQPEPDPREHWAFRAPQKLPLPNAARPNSPHTTAADQLQVAHPIDRWLESKRRERGVVAVRQADRRLLLRRLYLDLIGIPPTPAETQEFLADIRPDAYEQVVDQLLASPHYGERWGRHWMDIWRYSDWYGLGAQLRYSQKHIWRWRDWIVTSLNEDVGYDRMLRLMLAADELEPNNVDDLPATGFLARNYFLFNRTTWLDDTIEHTGKAFLGLTLNCAKCHDHKYDPISQTDYYRFRAIFEPHHVRLDPVPGVTDFEQDGLPRVYDEHIARPTYVHIRGDASQPDQDHPLEPGVPAVFGANEWSVQPVELPATAFLPALRAEIHEARSREFEQRVAQAAERLQQAQHRVSELEDKAVNVAADQRPRPLIDEDFREAVTERWQVIGDEWKFDGEGATQSASGPQSRSLRAKFATPRDFIARLRFRTLGGQQWKSVGIAFDAAAFDAAASDVAASDVAASSTTASSDAVSEATSDDREDGRVMAYLSAVQPGSKLQITYRQNRADQYPPDAALAMPVALDRDYELTLRVRDRLVNVWVDGQPRLAYKLPFPRRTGTIELVAFDAVTRFSHFTLAPLPDDERLYLPTEELVTADTAVAASERAEQALKVVSAERDAYTTAWLAERAAEGLEPQAGATPTLQQAAAKAYRLWKLEEARGKQLELRLDLFPAETPTTASLEQLSESQRKQWEAVALAVEQARALYDAPDETYLQLRGGKKALEGPDETADSNAARFPRQSTGRRAALARWVTARSNPLTARVAINHMWLRHFGQPLVDSVNDFGRRAPRPLHAELLDWLAVEFMEQGWSMKRMHRLMVTSQAYRASSRRELAPPKTRTVDPDNETYWHRRPIRMESQVVRDSLWAIAGQLDRTLGGPPVAATSDAPPHRRSLYFRHSRDDQHRFLNAFDDADILRCYRREESVIPQQALAMNNSLVSLAAAEALVEQLQIEAAQQGTSLRNDEWLIENAFEHCLGTLPEAETLVICRESLANMDALAQTQIQRNAAASESPDEARASKARASKARASEARASEAAELVRDVESATISDEARHRAAVMLIRAVLNSHDFVTIR